MDRFSGFRPISPAVGFRRRSPRTYDGTRLPPCNYGYGSVGPRKACSQCVGLGTALSGELRCRAFPFTLATVLDNLRYCKILSIDWLTENCAMIYNIMIIISMSVKRHKVVTSEALAAVIGLDEIKMFLA